MSETAALLTISVDVGVSPARAFELFVDIDSWWKRAPYSWNDSARATGIRFEPGVGGRWFEAWDGDGGEGWENGRILVWEPGVRLVFTHRPMKRPEPATEVEVRFDAIAGGTRVTLEHRAWERLAPEIVAEDFEHTRKGWTAALGWYRSAVESREGQEVIRC